MKVGTSRFSVPHTDSAISPLPLTVRVVGEDLIPSNLLDFSVFWGDVHFPP